MADFNIDLNLLGDEKKEPIRIFIKWLDTTGTMLGFYHDEEYSNYIVYGTYDDYLKLEKTIHDTNQEIKIVSYLVMTFRNKRLFYSPNDSAVDFDSKDWLMELLRYNKPLKFDVIIFKRLLKYLI